jgi:hypothetical protein
MSTYDEVLARATNAVKPAADTWNQVNAPRDRIFLPLSLRYEIGKQVAQALKEAGLIPSTMA